jgi:hypothetical protein
VTVAVTLLDAVAEFPEAVTAVLALLVCGALKDSDTSSEGVGVALADGAGDDDKLADKLWDTDKVTVGVSVAPGVTVAVFDSVRDSVAAERLRLMLAVAEATALSDADSASEAEVDADSVSVGAGVIVGLLDAVLDGVPTERLADAVTELPDAVAAALALCVSGTLGDAEISADQLGVALADGVGDVETLAEKVSDVDWVADVVSVAAGVTVGDAESDCDTVAERLQLSLALAEAGMLVVAERASEAELVTGCVRVGGGVIVGLVDDVRDAVSAERLVDTVIESDAVAAMLALRVSGTLDDAVSSFDGVGVALAEGAGDRDMLAEALSDHDGVSDAVGVAVTLLDAVSESPDAVAATLALRVGGTLKDSEISREGVSVALADGAGEDDRLAEALRVAD